MLWIKKLISDDMIIWGFRMFQNYFKQVRKDIFTGVSLNISMQWGLSATVFIQQSLRELIMVINLSENPEMSSSDMLHMFRDYMDSYDQLRLEMMATMLLT